MDSSEHEDKQEPTPPAPSEPVAHEVDLSEEEGFPEPKVDHEPDGDAKVPRQSMRSVRMATPRIAEPLKLPAQGIYVCLHDAGEHQMLGTLVEGQKYDYRQEHNPAVLEAVAACVEAGYLKKA